MGLGMRATPWVTFFTFSSRNVSSWLSPCSGQDISTYKDQTDVFYDSPVEYFQRYFPAQVNITFPPSPYPSTTPGAVVHVTNGDIGPWKHEWPQLLVTFGILWENQEVRALLKSRGYNEIWRAGWRWEGEGKRKGGVTVLRHSGNY
jgi:phosphatidylinositol glycan class B